MKNTDFNTVIGKIPPQKKNEKDTRLVIIAGNEIGKTFAITNKKEIILGRNESADFILIDPLISRKHASIIKTKDEIKLKDLNSTNGLFVNFNKIKEISLKDGDKITLGTTIIKFLHKDSVETSFHDEIYKLASLDGLTQIYNKKCFFELFKKEINRAKRHETALSCCIFDIDFFKKTNDTYGHQAGDFVLETLANLIKNQLRQEDIFARYGGEEFSILLPENNIKQALKTMNKIRTLVNKTIFHYKPIDISISISGGIQELTPEINTAKTILEHADKKLYIAKKKGRNKIVI
jgi:two-component system, cell cycle response regulator